MNLSGSINTPSKILPITKNGFFLITIETNIAKYTVKVMRYQYNNTNTQSRKVTVTYNIKGQNKEINIETAEIM